MNFNASVLSVSKASATSKAGKPYQLVEVAYKNNTFQGKVESVKINQYSPLYQTVAGLKGGDVIDVTKEKEGDFWQWKSIVQAPPGLVAGQVLAGPVVQQASNPIRGGWQGETPEERAKKQVMIVKQSSIAQAVALLTTGAKVPPSNELVLEQAQKFVDYVMGEKKQDLFSMPNDFPQDVEID